MVEPVRLSSAQGGRNPYWQERRDLGDRIEMSNQVVKVVYGVREVLRVLSQSSLGIFQ